ADDGPDLDVRKWSVVCFRIAHSSRGRGLKLALAIARGVCEFGSRAYYNLPFGGELSPPRSLGSGPAIQRRYSRDRCHSLLIFCIGDGLGRESRCSPV